MAEDERPWAQVSLALGGAFWVGWVLVMFVTGVTDGLVRVLVGFSGVFLAVGLLGVVLRLPWLYKFPGGEGCGIATFGGLVFAVGQWLTIALSAGSPVAEAIIAIGVLGLVGGTLLFAAGAARARRIPPWLAVGLVVGTVVFFGFDGGGLLTLLALPFGLVWLAFGGYLVQFPEQPSSNLEPSAIRR